MSLDPFEIILDQLDKNVGSLENQSRLIQPLVSEFRSDGIAFNPASISPTSQVNAAMADFTPDAIGAGVSDIEPINEFVDDCLAEAVAGIRRYIADILENMEDGIDLIDSILALAENLLMKQLQNIWKLVDSIQSLISSLDIKITCITSKDETGKYTAQVEAIENRMDTVIDDLYLADDGSFDNDKMMTGFNNDLQVNLDSYKSRSDHVQSQIADNIETTVNIPTTVNPSSRF
jgi:hypothetical protein